jgi:hypothetical protein
MIQMSRSRRFAGIFRLRFSLHRMVVPARKFFAKTRGNRSGDADADLNSETVHSNALWEFDLKT